MKALGAVAPGAFAFAEDSEAAAMEHAAKLADVSAEVLATVSVVHGELLGEPSEELRARLAGIELPQLFTPYESM